MSERWIRALRFAAMPEAAKVKFERRSENAASPNARQYRLRSFLSSGEVIGDDRDYDVLKAVMRPLEALADAEDHEDLRFELDLTTGHFSRQKIS